MLIVVVVYDRYQNLMRWLHCWGQCEHMGFKMVVIHNDNGRAKQFREACEKNNVIYIRRQNVGFDIGAMQDVFKERLSGFPNEWKYLLWCTDDVLPMQKDFLKPFVEAIEKNDVGVAAMHISPERKPHVRTGCFMISKVISGFITFPADPVTTKKECYQFEHGENCLSDQIRSMGLDCVQVAPIQSSPVYDTGYWVRNVKATRMYSKFNREREHKQVFY